MHLNDVAMVAGDTSRSRVYLQALARHDLLPSFVLLLDDGSGAVSPGQLQKSLTRQELQGLETNNCWSEADFDAEQPVKVLLENLQIPFEVSASKDINDPAVIDSIRRRAESVFIYSGFGGVLLRSEVLSTGKQFLHIHGGYLPDFKGSTTNYYSLLSDKSLGASAIFLNEHIDSGPILMRRKFPAPANRLAIDHIYDSAARAKVLVEVLQNFVSRGNWEFELDENFGGETYYIIHPLLKHIAILDQSSGS